MSPILEMSPVVHPDRRRRRPKLTDVAALNGGLGRPETQTNVLVLQF